MEHFDEFLQGTAVVFAALSLILAVIQGLFGYRLLKLWVALVGFLGGALLGGYLAKGFGAEGWILVLATVGAGIVLTVFAFRIFLLGVFLFCGFLGSFFILQTEFLQSGLLRFSLALAVGIALGILAVKFVRPTVISVSSLTAAATVSKGLPGFWQRFGTFPEVFDGKQGRLLLYFGTAAIFLLVQFSTTKAGASSQK